MLGWLVYKEKENQEKLKTEVFDVNYGKFWIKYNKYNKFFKEQISYSNDEFITITEGVLLNSIELCGEVGQLDEYITSEFSKKDLEIIKRFNGPFCGLFHNRKKNVTTIFTNRVGDRPVYYYSGDYFVASSNINMIIEFCKENNIEITFDENAGKMMLELGFMADTNTMAREIKRLFPGECLIWSENSYELNQYYMYDNSGDDTITMEEAIENVDKLFRQAVKRCFDKDNEYGYAHIADLSGGLDSRMTSWVARDLGYGPILNICWGITGCADEKIASAIAEKLGNDYVFQSINGMHFLQDIDENTIRNHGAALYAGPTGALRFAKILNSNNVGLKHTGQIGDVIVGAFVRKKTHEKPSMDCVVGFSNRHLFDIPIERYQNVEQARLYIRGFIGTTNSHQKQNEFWQVVSPFLDNDFLEYCQKVPLKLRINHQLYIQWMKKKYPDTLKIKRDGSFFSIYNTYKYYSITSRINFYTQKILNIGQKILYKLRISKYQYRIYGMTPFEAVLERHPEEQEYMNEYFANNIALFKENKKYENLLCEKYNNGTPYEKEMVLTVLAFVKNHNLRVV
mgnify:CR=1 FL=1